ncbi:MAG: hypothetical protein ACJ790_00800, partial [Myxococcaceae bacterium]
MATAAAAPRRSGPPHPWLKPAVFVGSLFPALEILIRALQGNLTANPASFMLNRFGLVALIFLLATLAMTP